MLLKSPDFFTDHYFSELLSTSIIINCLHCVQNSYNVPGFVFLQISLKFYWEIWIRLRHQNLWWSHQVLCSPCPLNPSKLNFPEKEIQLNNRCRHRSMPCLLPCKSNFLKSLYHETQIKIRRHIEKYSN